MHICLYAWLLSRYWGPPLLKCHVSLLLPHIHVFIRELLYSLSVSLVRILILGIIRFRFFSFCTTELNRYCLIFKEKFKLPWISDSAALSLLKYSQWAMGKQFALNVIFLVFWGIFVPLNWPKGFSCHNFCWSVLISFFSSPQYVFWRTHFFSVLFGGMFFLLWYLLGFCSLQKLKSVLLPLTSLGDSRQ